ncbi:Polyketide synthase [Metarhizium humberi]|uniref:Polyketide synthase n=1 Tax=Metarhizium humberi TaxID=2596975 RepID=A0A9P8S398_9HYPO|nr:Polyketide synthase [Metarhizium humberi]
MDSWTVYDMSSRRSDTHIAGDMFVFTKDNKLIITTSVVRFTLYDITKLEKVLQGSKIDNSRTTEPLSLTPKVTRGEVGGSGAKVKIYDHNYEDETMVATEAVSIEPTKNCKTIPSGDLAGYVHCCWFGEPSLLATGGKRSAGKRPGTQRLG